MGMPEDEQGVLYEGVPVWLRAPLRDWLTSVLEVASTNSYMRAQSRRTEWVQEYDSRTRRRSPLAPSFAMHGSLEVAAILEGSDDYIKFLDFLIWYMFETEWEGPEERLDEILTSGGSAWKVGTRDGVPGLERRVDVTVQTAADSAMAVPGHAGSLLSEAWHAAFGVTPDFEKAYAKSVKAVEAAAIPVVMPNHGSATLGTVLGQMRADGDWKLPLTREDTTEDSAAMLVRMGQTLWTGQQDRHAGQPGYQPSTREDAELAVFLAVTLVQFFTSGAVARR
ncbi:hypothetical protein BH11ACT3_BH11ACT3_19370 [soil metagenome]